jgi:hypothetical protein
VQIGSPRHAAIGSFPCVRPRLLYASLSRSFTFSLPRPNSLPLAHYSHYLFHAVYYYSCMPHSRCGYMRLRPYLILLMYCKMGRGCGRQTASRLAVHGDALVFATIPARAVQRRISPTPTGGGTVDSGERCMLTADKDTPLPIFLYGRSLQCR